MRRFLLVFLTAAGIAFTVWAADDNPQTRVRATVLLKRVDAGTLPTPVLGGIVYDVIDQRILISDGGTWSAACQ